MSTKSADKTAETAVEKAKVDREQTEAVESEVKTETQAAVKKRTGRASKKEEAAPADKKAEQTEEKPSKRTPRKTTAKKSEKPELKSEVYIEYQGQQVLETAIIEKVKEVYRESGHRISSIKSLQIYIKPEEFKAYYVINNGKYTGQVFIF